MSEFVVSRNKITIAMKKAIKTYKSKSGSLDLDHARALLNAVEVAYEGNEDVIKLDLNDASFVGEWYQKEVI